MPQEQRLQQPFVVDALSGKVIAPWPKRGAQAGDAERLEVLRATIDPAALPAPVCWCWPDRKPEPVQAVAPDWLARWARDHAVYALAGSR
jgi:hypothetical protein